MGILLAFAPFIAFVIVERLLGVPLGLAAGAVVSAALILQDWLKRRRKVKILEAGTFILFGGLTLLALSGIGESWSIAEVRLRVDGGLLLIVLVSMALRRPFTLQYAEENASSAARQNPQFIHANYVITAIWALAFAVLVAADLLLVYRPNLPHSIAIIATVLALFAAAKFTAWYPRYASEIASRTG